MSLKRTSTIYVSTALLLSRNNKKWPLAGKRKKKLSLKFLKFKKALEKRRISIWE